MGYDKAYYEKHKKRFPDYAKIMGKKGREENYEQWMLYLVKSSAKKRGLEFNLTIDDIIIPEYCPYLGIKMTRIIGEGIVGSNPSIDRINNELGYIKENVQVISNKANMMKQNASISELIIFAENILRKHKVN